MNCPKCTARGEVTRVIKQADGGIRRYFRCSGPVRHYFSSIERSNWRPQKRFVSTRRKKIIKSQK